MAQYFEIHPDNPQPRLIAQAVDILRSGGLIVYPTDSSFALGWMLGDKAAQDRVLQIRHLEPEHAFTLVCRDLSDIATYARVDNTVYRLLKAHTPGPYTFILKATRELPRRLQHPKRGTIGIRVPDHRVAAALLDKLGEPLMSSTLLLPDQDIPFTDAREIVDVLGHGVELVIDAGTCDIDPTSIIDLHTGLPDILREGKGDTGAFR